MASLNVEAETAGGRADLRHLTDGEHQLLAQIEPAPLFRVTFLHRGGKEGEGVGQVGEPVRAVVLNDEAGSWAAGDGVQGDGDHPGLLVVGVLEQFE